ncbi:hypothetical protein [Solibacillus sp. CAU 1738]|uniref:hypothetical protein n=1 Tax=Solibacillus sp. CAU 1738 TaxID=3140363 RepID=UPI0032601AA1
MHDPIRNALKEAYKERVFSEDKKQETLEKVNNKNKAWLPFSVTVIVTCCVLILTFWLVREPITEVVISSEQAPHTVEDIYMERWHEFMTIVENERNEQATLTYLAKSDWLLQRAIESGHSVFYSAPTLTDEEKRSLIELLHYMYQWVERPNRLIDFPQVETFDELTKQAPQLLGHLRGKYKKQPILTVEEQKAPKLRLFYMKPEEIISTLVFFGIFALLLYSNWTSKRNYFFAAIQVGVLCSILLVMFMPSSEKYAFDETTLLQQSIPTFDEPTIDPTVAKLSSASTFGDVRFALVDLGNGIHGLAKFYKNHIGYAWSGSQWGRQKIFTDWVQGVPGQVIAVQQGHGVSRIDLVEEQTKRILSIALDPDEAAIYFIGVPEDFRSYQMLYYSKDGVRMH